MLADMGQRVLESPPDEVGARRRGTVRDRIVLPDNGVGQENHGPTESHRNPLQGNPRSGGEHVSANVGHRTAEQQSKGAPEESGGRELLVSILP